MTTESSEVSFRLPQPQAMELAERAVKEAEDMLVHQGIKAIEELVGGMNSGMKTKQTELQLMVGSRYHELIESADHIVTMRDNVVHVAKSLQDIGNEVSSICDRLRERHQKSLSAVLDAEDSLDTLPEPGAPLRAAMAALGFPLSLQLEDLSQTSDGLVWDLMDRKRFVAAAFLVAVEPGGHPLRPVVTMEAQASLLEQAVNAAAAVDGSLGDDTDAAEWETRLQEDVQDAAEALTAMALLQAIEGDPLSFTEVYLEIRRDHVEELLHGISRGSDGDGATMDPHMLLKNLQQLLDETGDEHDLATSTSALLRRFSDVSSDYRRQIARMLTTWLADMCRLMFETSKDFMLGLTASSAPTFLLTQLQNNLRRVLQRGPEAEQRWDAACKAVVDGALLQDMLRKSAGESQAHTGRSRPRTSFVKVDLWNAIFGSTVSQIIGTLTTKAVDVYVDRILEALEDLVRAGLAAADKKSPVLPAATITSLTNTFQERSLRLIEQLEVKSQDISQPRAGTSQAPEHFPEHLVDLLCTKMVCIVHWFRNFSMPEVAEGESAPRQLPSAVRLTLCRALHGFVYENDKLCRILRPSAAAPGSASHRPRRNRASPQQLRASFDIADTDGDSYINSSECVDALEAVCPASVDINDLQGYMNDRRIDGQRISFHDFALLCASILDSRLESSGDGSRWDAHIVPAMASLLRKHLGDYSATVLERPFFDLERAYSDAKTMAQFVDDQQWRSQYQNWQCIKVRSGNADAGGVEDDDGYEEQLWFPHSATLALSRLLLACTNVYHMATPLSDVLVWQGEDSKDKSFSQFLSRAFGRTLRVRLSAVAKDLRSSLRNAKACESFLLQMTVDWAIVEACLSHFECDDSDDEEPQAPLLSPSQFREKCVDAIDPINWQLYEATMKILTDASVASLSKLVGLSGTSSAAALAAAQSSAARDTGLDIVGFASSDGGIDASSGLQHALATAGRVKRLGVLAIPMRAGPTRRAGAMESMSDRSMEDASDTKSAFTNAFSAFFGQSKA